MRSSRLAAALVLAVALVLTLRPASEANAQALERHPAPGQQQPTIAPIAPNEPPPDQDDRPLGANLSALILLRANDPADSAAAGLVKGVDASRLPVSDRRNLDQVLARFIGQPFSRKLISQIQTAIVEHYRRAGRPFLSVTPPPQDVTEGVLRLRVIPFRLGKKIASGASPRVDKAIEAGVRVKHGQLIEAPALQQDLDWLNRGPFRQVGAVFAQGEALGDTDLHLEGQSAKAWQVYGGYSNSGPHSSGIDRWTLGGQIGDLLVPGSLVAYALTSSDNFWISHGEVLGAASNPEYVSHSIVASMPVAARQDVTLTLNYIDSDTPAAAFTIRAQTEELTAVYRTAVSNLLPLPGDLSLGVELRAQQRDTYFGFSRVLSPGIDVGQMVVGWSDTWTLLSSRQTFSVTEHISPGGLGPGNYDANFLNFSNGRVAHSDYVYTALHYAGDYPLTGAWRYTTSLDAQFSNHALIDTEQMAVGGEGAARGYTYDDQAFDSGVVWRNELRAPNIILPKGWIVSLSSASPYLFADVANGQDRDAGHHSFVSDAGLGIDWRLDPHWTGGLSGAWAIKDAAYTRQAQFKLLASAQLAF